MKCAHILFNCVFTILLFLTAIVSAQYNADSPIEFSKRVADKIIRETSFEFQITQQKPSEAIQSINFGFEFPGENSGVAYAISYINSKSECEIKLGISHASPLKVWLNDKSVYSSSDNIDKYSEIAYDIYSFPKEIVARLDGGENKIFVKSILGKKSNSVHLALLDQNNLIKNNLSFSLSPLNKKLETDQKWLLVGPFESHEVPSDNLLETVFPPENGFNNYYGKADPFLNWQLPKTRLIIKDVMKPEYSFQQHSYFEWHYSNGQTMLAFALLAQASKETRYLEHVKKYCMTTIREYDYFRYQYYAMNEKTGFNYRIYRKSMLDDSSAPVLPFIELYNNGDLPESKFIIDIMADYISNGQTRLRDATLCRPEPEQNTIWADDLFMGVPFLLRYAKMTDNNKYFDDAGKQVINFFKYLFDEKLGISFHAWYDQKQKNSIAHWGRANGWMVWAVSEALLHLPKSNKAYNRILGIYKKQMEGLIRYQSKSGLWHQVLDEPDSYEETSCTAMFVIALSRGLRNGWLDQKYKENLLRAWEAIKTKIGPDGTVTGICQGTGIGDNLEFYLKRKTPPHDPRGLGAVITAGIEIQLLLDQNK